jgi:dTDP-glucose 4,6-dehydratase
MIEKSDLDEIIHHAADDMRFFNGKRILITGGTGFVGRWLTASIIHAKLWAKVQIEYAAVGRECYFSGRFDAVIHASPTPPNDILALASEWGHVPVLYLSSGAVYGQRTSYAQEKREGEMACLEYGNARIARLFSFIGPHVPNRFAAGAFIERAVAGETPIVTGSDTRSWLYPTDMVIALWRIFARGKPGEAHDVGSVEPVTVLELAAKIDKAAKSKAGYRPNPGGMGVQRVYLDEAIKRTLEFYESS